MQTIHLMFGTGLLCFIAGTHVGVKVTNEELHRSSNVRTEDFNRKSYIWTNDEGFACRRLIIWENRKCQTANNPLILTNKLLSQR